MIFRKNKGKTNERLRSMPIEPIYVSPLEDTTEDVRMIRKPILQSRTTQNVAVGAVSGQGIAIGVIQVLRRFFPDVLPWDASQDQTVAQALGVILTPLISRLLSRLRQ